MLYDLSWLNKGKVFPPLSEAERLQNYKDSRELFKGNTEMVLSSYQQRIAEITGKLDLNTTYKMDINYHRLLTVKTADLVCGEMPNITTDIDIDIKSVLKKTKFKQKLYESVCDISRMGDSIARVYLREDTNKYDFVIMPPDNWFPVVDKENIKEPVLHCLARVDKLNDNPYDTKAILKVQIHSKGKFETRSYELINGVKNSPITINSAVSNNPVHSRSFNMQTYTIGDEYVSERKTYNTGLKDFAVIPLQNLTLPDSIYAYNDYEPITSIIAELEVRCMLENAVLDKHTAPTIYADESNFAQNPITRQMEFGTGKAVKVGDSSVPPGYMVWDANLTANHEMIKFLKDLLYSITELGAVINDEAFGASQGYEALLTRMTSARMKARRISDNLTDNIAKLISMLTLRGYGKTLAEDDITIEWNDGIPDTELQNIDIATRKLSLFPIREILMTHFGATEDKADDIVNMLMEEKSLNLSNGFATGVGV